MIDLHMHTVYSDGRYTPAEMVQLAVERHCAAIAITDHDTVRGAIDGVPYARAAGIELVPGVEMTTQWPGVNDEVDVLGYFIDTANPTLEAALARSDDHLRQRVTTACARLSECGYPVEVSDVDAQNPRKLSYLSVIRALQAKNYAPDYASAAVLFRAALPGIAPFGLPIDEAIAVIRAAGGVAVLAHPVYVREESRLTVADIEQLVHMGLGGLETLHPSLNDENRRYYQSLAREFDLAMTGGSDEHGWLEMSLGTEPVTQAMLDDLRARRR